MSIKLEFINLIIPKKTIEKKYPGGWEQLSFDRQINLDCGADWFDEDLYRAGAMNDMGIDIMLSELEKKGLKLYKGKGKLRQWNDVCVVYNFSDKPTLPCDWIDIRGSMASLKKNILPFPAPQLRNPFIRSRG